ncbi:MULTISPECIES: FmdB family zinc ribbon protein [unclassified Schlesneria]|uniref:FmdB family zinc ribbon protein n=1 Tax=unclassified Schlesneria TaxID=2762017 RepID=UPI002F0BEC4A
MPLYEYAVVNDDGSHGQVFEVLQKIGEPPLTTHPETGQPVERIISAASVPRPMGGPIKGDISNRNLEKLGFTKYQKSSTGSYEKVLGDGPDLIKRDNL